MQKRQALINAIFTIVQIMVASIILFFLYKFLLINIGVEQLGIWSLILAATAISQVANLGLSGSITKFVAKYITRGEGTNTLLVIQTAIVFIGFVTGTILLGCYPIFKWLLGLIIHGQSLLEAVSVLPFAIFALWLSMITAILHAGLDGFQRIDIRNFILIGDSTLQLLLCYAFVPKNGLMGLAYARVIGSIATLVISWILLKKLLPSLNILRYRWNKDIFKEILGYSMNFQAISIAAMFCEPVTKGLLGKFGSLALVGYYEMANKLVQQFRSVIVSTNQIVVPIIADLQERLPEKIRMVYLTSYRLLFYIAFPLYFTLIVFIPLICRLWIGHYEGIFVLFAILLSIGQLLNTLAGPAYFSNLGIGNLRWNLAGHILMALLNAILGFLLGFMFDGIGVVVAWIVSLALGSSIIYISYHVIYEIPLIELFPKQSIKVACICVAGAIFSLIVQATLNDISADIIGAVLFLLIISVPAWIHPMRKQAVGWVKNYLLKNPAFL
jgi:O-antigen/teichoic acid export membrane protein